MRIAFLTSEFVSEEQSFDGGLSRYLLKAAIELTKHGHKPIVVVVSKKNEIIYYNNIEVHRVKPKNTFCYKIADKISRFKYQRSLDILRDSYFLNKKIKEINKAEKIDIIQYPNFRSISFFSPRRIKSVLRISSYQKLWDEANGLFYKSISERQSQIIEYFCFKKAKSIFGPSEFLAEFIQDKFNKKVTLIETPFQPINKELNVDLLNEIKKKTDGNKYLLFYGRIALFKGAIDIADTLNSLLSKHPNLFIVIIGKDIGYENDKSMNYVYNKAGVFKNRVIHYQEKPHAQLMPVIQSAHFVLLPSRIENLPNACLEAMSLNKIVVATRGVSFEQLISDGINGFLCENANPDDLLRVIEKVLTLAPAKMKEIEYSAGKSIDRLHPNVTIKKLIEYYQSVLKK